MTPLSTRSRSRAVLMTVPAAVLLAAILSGLSYLQWRQAQLDHALVAAIQRPGASLATVQALLDRGANPNARAI
jgi:hypothetical protein